VELVPDFGQTSSRSGRPRHWLRWSVLAIVAIFVLANWRFIAAMIAVAAVTSIVIGLLIVIVVIRKATRPIGQLSLIDVAVFTWLLRRWESWRMSPRPSDTSNIRNIRPR
jgi:uncharacterized membrane protein YhaH (DUF805 family)